MGSAPSANTLGSVWTPDEVARIKRCKDVQKRAAEYITRYVFDGGNNKNSCIYIIISVLLQLLQSLAGTRLIRCLRYGYRQKMLDKQQ
jgi:hypothetical protein